MVNLGDLAWNTVGQFLFYSTHASSKIIVLDILNTHEWLCFPCQLNCLVGIVAKVSALRAEDHRFESRLRQDFTGVESYQWLKNWHSSGYPAGRLVL